MHLKVPDVPESQQVILLLPELDMTDQARFATDLVSGDFGSRTWCHPNLVVAHFENGEAPFHEYFSRGCLDLFTIA
jgi:hypothetical protein